MIQIKLDHFFDEYDLHDSIVESIHYNPSRAQLTLEMELCRWRQSFYKVDESELEVGRLIFSKTDYYKIEPPNTMFKSNDILKADIITTTTGEKVLKIVLFGEPEAILIEIKADSVEWRSA